MQPVQRLSPGRVSSRLLFSAMALLLGHGLWVLGQGPPEKLPEPDKTAQGHAEIVLLRMFKDDFKKAKADPAAALDLAALLLKEAKVTRDDDVLRFMALCQARDLAARAGDMTLAMDAVADLTKLYAVDTRTTKARMLTGAADKITSPDAAATLIRMAFLTLEEAVTADDYATATAMVAAAEKAVPHVKEGQLPLTARIQKRAAEVAAAQKAFEQIRPFLAKLEKAPDDADANLQVGKHLCVVNGNFKRGLPLLAKSGEGAWKTLAVMDLANPTGAKAQVALGEAWDKLADGLKTLPQRHLHQRAHDWYGKALPQLAGLSKLRIERRFDELDKQYNQFAADLVFLKPRPFSNSIGMQLVPIPAGKFLMGAPNGEANARPDEMPQHEVEISKPFYMGAHEVTQAQYEKVMGHNPSQSKGMNGMDTQDFPVEKVTWDQAKEFCQRLSELPDEKRAGRTYRLPSEAEWEYACRAGKPTPFATGDTLTTQDANFQGQPALNRIAKVGSYKPNAWGLYDMHGNVWEWCADWYDGTYYGRSPKKDPQGPDNGTARVHHGGSYLTPVHECRAAYRISNAPTSSFHDNGFRVACTVGRNP